jgi:hypothetical protein
MAYPQRVGARSIMPLRDPRSYRPSFDDAELAKLSRTEIAAMPISPFVKDSRELFVDGKDVFRRRQMMTDLDKIPSLPFIYTNPMYSQPTTRQGYESATCKLEKDYIYNHFDSKKPRGQASQECALSTPQPIARGAGQLKLITRNQETFKKLQGYTARRMVGKSSSS